MKLYYLDRPEGAYYSPSFAVMADSPAAAAVAVNAYFSEMRAKPYSERGDSDWTVEWTANDFSAAEPGVVVVL